MKKLHFYVNFDVNIPISQFNQEMISKLVDEISIASIILISTKVTIKRNTEPLIKSTNSFFQVNMNDRAQKRLCT